VFPTTNSIPLKLLLTNSFKFGIFGALPLVVSNLKYRFKFRQTLQNFKHRLSSHTKVFLVNHHVSHLASGFFLSPFSKAAILTVDGAGDGLTSLLACGDNNQITKINSAEFPYSIGLLYYLVTKHLGFGGFDGGEGKVMGLSSYGDPNRYIEIFRDIIKLKSNGAYELNMKYFTIFHTGFLRGTTRFSDYFTKKFGPIRKSGDPILKEHEDIAAGLQQVIEETVVHVLKYLYEKTKCENLVLSGGVALNSVMNGKLHRQTPFKNIFISPIAYDGGNAVGASFYVWNVILANPRHYQKASCYLGPEFSDESVKHILDDNKLNYEVLDDAPKRAAELISDGKIVGWFQGRMEAGARALGNRSILADPRRAEMKDIVNKQVKHREPFRPFAPAILAEKVGEYFEDNLSVSFMERVFNIKPEKRKLIPAVTHVDGTGRLQTVTRQDNNLFYNLINEFNRITGVPVVLNTSFNVKGEPIVCSPIDAIRCFYSTGMDYLIIGKFLIKK
jgi:carbamoyltransferase